MNPVSFAPGTVYGLIPIIIPIENNQYYDIFYGTLTASEQEAVERVRDQFHSKAELKAFIKGLRN